MTVSGKLITAGLFAAVVITYPFAVEANPPKRGDSPHMSGGKGYSMSPRKGHSKEQYGDKGKTHLFTNNWRHSLSDKQKNKADRMHVALKKETTVLKASIQVKKAELKTLITQDDVQIQTVESKIDEILDAKRKLMRAKYAHKVEIRKMLTPEQKLSFDMSILRSSHSMGSRHR